MRKFFVFASVIVGFIASWPQAVWALPLNRLLVIPDGVTEITPPGWKEPMYIVKAWRNNPNAHGFFNITFLAGDVDVKQIKGDEQSVNWDDDENAHLEVIGVHNEMGVSQSSIGTWHISSITVSDYKLFFTKENMYLIAANQAGSALDTRDPKTHFTIFKLKANDQDDPKMDTPFFFARIKSFASAQGNKDADQAMDTETKRITELTK